MRLSLLHLSIRVREGEEGEGKRGEEINCSPLSDACIGGSNSLEGATKVCATSFVICKEGEVTAVMNCAYGTFFNEKTKECDYREVACAGGWSGEGKEKSG